MKIHQEGAKIYNKMCSFEVSKELLPLILIILATEPLFSITHTLIFCSVLAEPYKHILVTTTFFLIPFCLDT